MDRLPIRLLQLSQSSGEEVSFLSVCRLKLHQVTDSNGISLYKIDSSPEGLA